VWSVTTVNYLLLEALDTYAVVCDDVMTSRDQSVTSRDQPVTLSAAAADIRRRLAAIFLLDSRNERPLHAGLSVCPSVCLSVILSLMYVTRKNTVTMRGSIH